MFDRVIVLDFETAWATKAVPPLTLSHQTTEEYIRDTRFKAWGLCWKDLGAEGAAAWVRRKDLHTFFQSIDWSRTAVLAHNCLTGDHEVRTRSGWVRFDALQDGQEIMQWDVATGCMEFVPALVVRQHYAGKLLEWDTQYHKGVYTPNHRMYYQTPASGWQVADAAAVARMGQNNAYVPSAGFFEPDVALVLSELEARILEMVRADGNITAAFDARFRFKKQRKIERCIALLDAACVPYSVAKRDGVCCINTHASAKLRRLCVLLGAGRQKELGKWVLELSIGARQAWLDELQYWDGSVATLHGHGQTSVHSAKHADTEWLYEMAIMTGRGANVCPSKPNTRGFSRLDSVLSKVNVRQRNRAKLLRAPKEIDHDGMVYCATVPTGAFLVRRNGATWVTGNSQFDVSVMEWHYNAHPCFIFDSLSMARALHGVEVGNSLAKLAARFGLPPKGDAVHSTNGILDELPFEIEQELADYCRHDVLLCEEIFQRLAEGYPRKELELIDLTLKMFTRPLLELDSKMLEEALGEEKVQREELLTRLNVPEKDLASNDKFAQILETMGVPAPTKPKKPTKKTPNPKGTLFAFAKTDAMFQAMLNGDNDDVALLCEARLKVKSTQARTRAQRFLDISRRGTLPVPLNYFGTLTGRWSASKGSQINMQNMKRGSFLRKSIMAPAGQQIIVSDLSQIEPRVLAMLAGYEELLDIFRSGKDAYATFGATMFNIPGMTKESHPLLRQSAKSALLGCFGADTKVLTDEGWKPIIQVSRHNSLWDGVEWVSHRGVVDRGERETLRAYGVQATADHEILTERGWRGWSEVLQSPSLFKSARSLANSLVSVGNGWGSAFIRACGVAAVGKASFTGQTLQGAGLRAVEHALSRRLLKRVGRRKGTTHSAPIELIETAYWTASARSLSGARILAVRRIQTTAAAASRFIRRGLQTARNFLRTWSSSMAGISLNCSSIASATTRGTSPATCASARAASTWPTSDASRLEKLSSFVAESKILRQRMQTYDIAYAGLRNRYMVLTDEGPIIVHNCGYYLGWASFAQQLLVGFLGAPPVRYDLKFAKMLGVSVEEAAAFAAGKAGEERMVRMADIPHTCSDEELFVHCVCAKRIIDTYRATAAPVVAYWKLLQELIESALYGGEPYEHKCLRFEKGRIVLPNSMALRYPDLQFEKDKKGNVEWTYAVGPMRKKLHAGVLAENTTSALARIVMTDAMLRVGKRYPIAGSVHDEIIVVAPDAEVEEACAWVQAQMVKEPSYLPGIPLGAETGANRRYGLAKS